MPARDDGFSLGPNRPEQKRRDVVDTIVISMMDPDEDMVPVEEPDRKDEDFPTDPRVNDWKKPQKGLVLV